MKVNFDAEPLDIPCPHCGHKFRDTFGRLKSKPDRTCGRCGKAFRVDSSQLAAAVKQVEKALADFGRALGRIGKR